MRERRNSALITGASSGIGAALARRLATADAILHLSGRDAARLEQVAAECRARGADVQASVMDVRDAAAMATWIQGVGRLDLVVANAGISAGTADGVAESAAQTRAIFATNLDGVLNTALPAWAAMRAQAPGPDGVRGRIATIASIAAFLAVPGAPSYCASKAAVDAWTVGSAPAAAREGVRLTSVCPGYIRTPMTDRNRFPMPGLMEADRAAELILRGVTAGRVRLVFPWWLGALARGTALLPAPLVARLAATQPGKEAAGAG